MGKKREGESIRLQTRGEVDFKFDQIGPNVSLIKLSG